MKVIKIVRYDREYIQKERRKKREKNNGEKDRKIENGLFKIKRDIQRQKGKTRHLNR